MTLFQDLIGGWKARPLHTLAGIFLALGLSLLISAGLWMLQKAETEAESLLKSWPEDQCTLLLPGTLNGNQWMNLEQRLPSSAWMAIERSDRTAWVSGTLPETFFEGRGSSLPPEVISRGDAAMLIQESRTGSGNPGDIELLDGKAFRIYGVGRLALPVERVVPRRAKNLAPITPQQVQIRKPASEVIPTLDDLLRQDGFQLVDHQEKRFSALHSFRKLRRNLTGVAIASALLAALLLQALSQAEIRERKAEFALRRSLGARPQDIRNQLLLESLAGSALPCLAGTMAFVSLVSLNRLIAAFLITLGWIILCAGIPALQAARIPPGEALKGE